MGTITFGNAFKIGILITLVASLFYVIGWMIYYHSTDSASNFLEQYMEYTATKMEAAGSTQTEIDEFKKESIDFAEMYKNPLVMAGVTLLEIFPVGLIISLLSSLILKRNPELATN